MKKQILILFMALFALGATQVFAQGPYLLPAPIECIDVENPLTPVAGRPYTYTVNVPSPDGTKTYQWYVTQDLDFISDGVLNDGTAELDDGTSPILASGDGHYNVPTEGANTIELTWQSFTLDPTQYVFVVIHVINDGTGYDGCITDNLKVYRIQPLHAFTLTMANIDGDAIDYDVTEICVDDVQSAIFDPTWDDGNGGVVYDYGQNEFYFAVAAANFSGNFQLAGTLTGLQAATPGGTIDQAATLYWDYTLAGLDADPNEVPITAAETIIGEIIPPAGVSYGEGDEGDDDAAFMIYIKVVVEHNQFEATTEVDYILALDAVLADDEGDFGAHNNDNDLGDLEQDSCERLAFHNEATQQLRPRPTVVPIDPDEFLPNAP